jgi:hypothetical protein
LPELNEYLKKIGASYFLQGGYYGHDIELILGTGSVVERGDYIIYTIKKEFFHTPNTIIPMAAVIGNHEIFVRERSLLTIFQQKWVPVAEYFQFMSSFSHDVLSETIKKKAVTCYSKDPLLFEKEKTSFISDLTDIVCHHELGHAVIQHNLLKQEIATCSEATKLFDENIITALLELLADMAPFHTNLHGPLQLMVSLSHKNTEHAERLFYMYLSDTYFYDTQDEYMYHYSDLITSVMSSVIQSDSSVDFKLLETFLDDTNETSLIRWVLDQVSCIVSTLLSDIRSICFENNGGLFQNAIVASEQNVMDSVVLDKKSYEFSVSVWTDFFTTLSENDGYKQKIKETLKESKLKFLYELRQKLGNNSLFENEEKFRSELKEMLLTKLV